MRAFDYERELSKLMVPEVVNALSAIHAFRARLELRQELRPVLRVHRDKLAWPRLRVSGGTVRLAIFGTMRYAWHVK